MARPLLIKGPAVARFYSEQAGRPYADLDLLVRESDLGRWDAFLCDLGYGSPGSWALRWGPRFTGEICHVRLAGDHRILVELHAYLHHAARHLGYEAFAPHAAAGPLGLLELSAPAHLVVCALHLCHHFPRDREDKWLKDLAILGSPDAVGDARRLADEWGVRWALEHALGLAETALGTQGWRPVRVPLPALQKVIEKNPSRFKYRAALLRELGFREAAVYLGSRFDPARFAGPDRRVSARALASWLRWRLGPSGRRA